MTEIDCMMLFALSGTLFYEQSFFFVVHKGSCPCRCTGVLCWLVGVPVQIGVGSRGASMKLYLCYNLPVKISLAGG